MKNLKITIARLPLIGRLLLMGARGLTAMKYLYQTPLIFIKWLFTSREITNFTYHLEESNRKYLIALLADVLNTSYIQIETYVKELEEDQNLKNHLLTATLQSELACIADREVRYARRIGWYAIARVLKPQVIIETGVDKGLGACVLTAALMKNQQEGYQGRYFGTDINPKAGYLLSGEYAQFGSILYGDSIESLQKFDQRIDLFINDSDHSSDYEAKEYETVASKLSGNAFILGDNAHATDKLFCFARQTQRDFIFFRETPADHWYPGGGIGICFKRGAALALNKGEL